MKNFMKKIQGIGTFLNGFIYQAIFFAMFVLGMLLIVVAFMPLPSSIHLSTKAEIITKIQSFVIGSGVIYFLLFFVKSDSKKSLWFSLGKDFFYIVLMTMLFLDCLLKYKLFWATVSLVWLVILVVCSFKILKQIFLYKKINNIPLVFVENDVKTGQGYTSVDFYPFRANPNIENIRYHMQKNKNNPEYKEVTEDLESLLQLEFSTCAKTEGGDYVRLMFESKEKLQKFLDENAKN